jgi:hypothetical protein
MNEFKKGKINVKTIKFIIVIVRNDKCQASAVISNHPFR